MALEMDNYQAHDRLVSTKLAEMLAREKYGAESGALYSDLDSDDTVVDFRFVLKQHGMKKLRGNFEKRTQLEKSIVIGTDEFYDEITMRLRDLKKKRSASFQLDAQGMPEQVPSFIDVKVASLLKESGAAFTGSTFDGKPYFSKTHPRFSGKGTQSNLDDGGGGDGYWYLFDTKKMAPVIWLWFARPNTDKFGPESEWARDNQEVRWRLMADCGFGMGVWYYGYASNKPLTKANLQAAKLAMMSLKNDAKTDGEDAQMGIKPNLLVTGAANDLTRLELMNSTIVGGDSNVMQGAFESMTFSYLP
jgi:hypothetical protein